MVSQDSAEDSSKAGQFCYKVTIPNFPLPAPHNSFQSASWKGSSDDAKTEVASLVLSMLRISPEYLGPAVLRPSYEHHPAPAPPIFPLNPAQLQGVPLTAGWPAGF